MQDRSSKITFDHEADAGTEPSWMIVHTFKRYLPAREEERFNVLFVFPDEKRAKAFARRAEKFLDKTTPSTLKFLLFATLEEITVNPLGAICHIAHGTEKFPVVPNLLK